MPTLPTDYFHQTDKWWNQPGRYGHGLFDLLTPAMAYSISQANVTGSACEMASDAAYSLLEALDTNLSRLVVSVRAEAVPLLASVHVLDSWHRSGASHQRM